MSEHSQFWDDLNSDLERPEYREMFARYEKHVQDSSFRMGFHDGYRSVLPILTDLLAHMREENSHCCDCTWVNDAVEEFEARLREVTDDV